MLKCFVVDVVAIVLDATFLNFVAAVVVVYYMAIEYVVVVDVVAVAVADDVVVVVVVAAELVDDWHRNSLKVKWRSLLLLEKFEVAVVVVAAAERN